MYGCERWIIKKAECQRTNAFKLWYWRTLESPLDSKENKSANLKGNQPWIFIGRLMLKLKLQYFGHLMWRGESLEKTLMLGKTEGRRQRWEDEMVGSLTQWNELEQIPGTWVEQISEGQGRLACCGLWSCKESDMTEWLNWTEQKEWGIPGGMSDKEPDCQFRRHKRRGFNPWVRRSPWRWAWQSTPVIMPGESQEERSLAGYSP